MRNKQQMMDLILRVAREDERVRVVGVEGSRTNPHVPKDEFQDYDLSYLVTDMASYKQSDAWLEVFGPRIIMQKPEDMELFPPELGGWFSYLMLFEDGNRVDLKLVPIEELDRYLGHDGLLKILLDKDSRIACPPLPTDEAYHVKCPTARMYDDGCNEFWWVSTYVVKGLCRGEMLYAIEHLNRYVRPALLRMLAWQVGTETRFSLSVGKAYKYLDNYVAAETMDTLLATCRNGTSEEIWQALLGCYQLFRHSAAMVAERLGYEYPPYDKRVTAYTLQKKREYFDNA